MSPLRAALRPGPAVRCTVFTRPGCDPAVATAKSYPGVTMSLMQIVRAPLAAALLAVAAWATGAEACASAGAGVEA